MNAWVREVKATQIYILNIFSWEFARPIKTKFHIEPLWIGRTKICSKGPGHMTKTAAVPIYGKNPLKIFFSETSKFGLGVHWSVNSPLLDLHDAFRKFPKYSDTHKICCNHSKIWTMWLYHRVMSPNDAEGMANSVDPDWSSLIWVCTVCPGISVRKLRIISVTKLCLLITKSLNFDEKIVN